MLKHVVSTLTLLYKLIRQIYVENCLRYFILTLSFLFKSELFHHTYCKGIGLLLHLITLKDTYTLGRTTRDEG